MKSGDRPKDFQQIVWDFYAAHRRQLPWRVPAADGKYDAYHILVSELMLQQTQVNRVIPKYEDFLKQFPTVASLAEADLGTVLKAWSGLGYNRRAKFLWQAAQAIVERFGGRVPDNLADLTSLPGVGANTAGAILVYACNQPAVFVETNIRTVMLHHFFADAEQVSDKEILAKLTDNLPSKNYREFYWALMDYGTHLKSSSPRHLHRAKAHTKQSKFDGSARQLRGRILRLLGEQPWSANELFAELHDERSEQILHDLQQESLIHLDDGIFSLG